MERANLKPLLSGSDQKTLDKIEVTYNKGKNLENEANIISSSGTTDKEKAKNEKKYTLKRLEAAQIYQKANGDLLELFKDNIAKFWKENKNSKIDPSVKNYEDKATEISRKAKSTRKVAEDLTYPNEKLSKMIEAENLESEAITIYTKVLYAYLNYPISYDAISKNQINNETAKTDTIKPSEKRDEVNYIQAEQPLRKDTVVQPSEIKKDTLNGVPSKSIIEKNEVTNPPVSAFVEQNKVLSKDTASLYNMMQVKEEQVDEFNKFLEEKYPQKFENYVLNFRDINYGDFDSIRAAWTRYNQYQFTDDEIASLKKQQKDSSAFIADVTTDSNQKQIARVEENDKQAKQVANANQTKPTDKQVTDNSITNKQTKKNTTTSKTKVPVTTPTQEQTEVGKRTQMDVAKGFVYRVQISACRIPIDSKSLRNIYGGGLKIIELNEENWYKYAIGEFNTYAEARHLRDAVNIPGAFVIAYLNGKRIQVLNTTTSQIPDNYNSYQGNLTYKVQIAAAKYPLNKKYISHIYSGTQTVEEKREDGWYKYSIVTGPSLKAAKQFIEKENIPGAFITAYMGNTRIELKEALKINKKKQ